MPPPLPVEIIVRRRSPLVGRAAELAAFEQAWERVEGGNRQVVFIGGEPVRQVRLAAEVAGKLADHDVAVLVGSSTADAGVPDEPFAGALDRLLLAGSAGCLAAPLAETAPQLRRLSSHVDRHVADTLPPDQTGVAQRVLFDALTSFLRRLATDRRSGVDPSRICTGRSRQPLQCSNRW